MEWESRFLATYHHFSQMPLGGQTVFTAVIAIELNGGAQPAPEPGTLAPFAAGLGLLALRRRRVA